MEWLIVNVLLVLLCLSATGQALQDYCVPFKDDPACGCTFLESGETIDLRRLGKQNGEPA